MRFKRRYFCVELIFQEADLNSIQGRLQLNKLKHNQISETINKSIEKFFGDLGAAEMTPSFSVIYHNANTNLAILRTARNLEKKFHTLLTFIQKIDQFDVKLSVIHKSGSIKKCKQFLLEYCNKKLFELYKNQNDIKNIPFDNTSSVIEVLEKMVNACEQADYNFS